MTAAAEVKHKRFQKMTDVLKKHGVTVFQIDAAMNPGQYDVLRTPVKLHPAIEFEINSIFPPFGIRYERLTNLEMETLDKSDLTRLPESSGVKHDGEKTMMELLSPLWVSGVADVLTFGARKYAAHNWRKGIVLSRLLGACLRHVFAFLGGEDNDKESGLPHLHHASCCLMFASELHKTRPDLDDRYGVQQGSTVVAGMATQAALKIPPITTGQMQHVETQMPLPIPTVHQYRGEWIEVEITDDDGKGRDLLAFVPNDQTALTVEAGVKSGLVDWISFKREGGLNENS